MIISWIDMFGGEKVGLQKVIAKVRLSKALERHQNLCR